MELKIIALYDKAVGAYMRPFVAQSVGEAMRAFEDDCADAESPVAKHPEDYSLFLLGTFDNNTGAIEVEDSPLKLVNAHEVVSKLRNIVPGSLGKFDPAGSFCDRNLVTVEDVLEGDSVNAS